MDTDGGGIRGYASLWMLKLLMDEIGKIERNDPVSPHKSSFCPTIPAPEPERNAEGTQSIRPENTGIQTRTSTTDGAEITPQGGASSYVADAPLRTEGYLPCHYFDYIAGTSTGG